MWASMHKLGSLALAFARKRDGTATRVHVYRYIGIVAFGLPLAARSAVAFLFFLSVSRFTPFP